MQVGVSPPVPDSNVLFETGLVDGLQSVTTGDDTGDGVFDIDPTDGLLDDLTVTLSLLAFDGSGSGRVAVPFLIAGGSEAVTSTQVAYTGAPWALCVCCTKLT